MYDAHKKSYGHRALEQKNPAAKLLLETMERKKSNLAVSVDVTRTKDFLAIIDVVGPFVCLIKAIFRSSEGSVSYSHRI
jgi:orotidine-5'-phosphate decarboxylase